MSKKSANTTSNQLTLFAADSLASHTVWPGSEKARQMTVTSGRNIAGLLPNSNRLGLLVKMCLESSQLFSTRCYLTWKVSTTPGKRLLFRLAVSMPSTKEIEYGLLPTARATDGEKGSRTADGALRELKRGRNKDLGMLAALWPTLHGNCYTGAGTQGRMGGLNLQTAVMYATPSARDWRSGKASEETHNRNSRPLSEQVGKLENGGQLNPEFVEWLMGFPIGWTDLEHSEMP